MRASLPVGMSFPIYTEGKILLDDAVMSVVQLMTFYALGQWIVKEQGEKRAKYGQYIIRKLSAALTEKYGRGFLEDTLKNARKFYLTYRDRISETTFSLFGDTLPFILSWSHYLILMRIERVMRLKWGKAICLKPDRNVLLLMRIRTIKIPIVDFSSSSFTYLS